MFRLGLILAPAGAVFAVTGTALFLQFTPMHAVGLDVLRGVLESLQQILFVGGLCLLAASATARHFEFLELHMKQEHDGDFSSRNERQK